MREIKFRGYSIKENKWKYGYLSKYNNKHGISDDMGIGNFVYKESIGEYTGEKDINGQEIYEGDIVKSGTITGAVIWHKGGWKLKIDNEYVMDLVPKSTPVNNLVIGNIYENPELMEVE